MDLDSVYPDLNALTRSLAKLVYEDLLNDERLSNIKPQFEQSLNVFYLTADKETIKQVAFIPLPHSKDIDFGLIKLLQQKLESSRICVAIVDNTGNILYYQIDEGFNSDT
ncbi:uncharacterized protein LOC117785290 [Drosophila innubila]|uniref:uncharacterized protein LOC117785290 n=1 Tax=Drosophila innubila TaxID=198719 RepID=UPI00148DF349|nr:uncharacterized protein LOC117785290 [Drosophila innubila]